MPGSGALLDPTRIQRVDPAKIKIGERFRKELGDLSQLQRSLGKIGMLHPILVREDFTLLVGLRRLAAAKAAKWQTVPVLVCERLRTAEEWLEAERDENECREPPLPSEAAALGDAIKEFAAKEAAASQAATQAKPGQKVGAAQGGRKLRPPSKPAKKGTSRAGRTAARIAAAVGMSEGTYRKAAAVVAAAKADQAKNGDLVEQMDRTGRVDPAYRELQRRQHVPDPQAWAAGAVRDLAPALPAIVKVVERDEVKRRLALATAATDAKKAVERLQRLLLAEAAS